MLIAGTKMLHVDQVKTLAGIQTLCMQEHTLGCCNNWAPFWSLMTNGSQSQLHLRHRISVSRQRKLGLSLVELLYGGNIPASLT